MCGISGFVSCSADVESPLIDRQLELLRHRGPDASGRSGGGPAVIAQNRLAIIDVEGGDPPILNEDATASAVLNGEVYNFRALREELRARGHRFTTGCDTEVIVHLGEDEEPAVLAQRLDGMFAFALWDGRRRRLVLGRDRLGKKPLYYWSGNGAFVFASEIKAVLAHPAVSRELDPGAIPAFLTFGYVPTPRTFYAGVLSVPPGHVLILHPEEAPRLERYWAPRIPRPGGVARRELSLPAAGREVRAALETAVGRRLISDVPLGAFLSGGIDSSAIVGVMSQLVEAPVDTFTIGFEDTEGFDERSHARAVARRHRTNHHEFVVAPDAVDLVERLTWHHDQPFGDSSAIPTYLLCEQTRGHVTVALTGDGGDELFAGYERFIAALAISAYRAIPPGLRRTGSSAIDALPGGLAGGLGAKLQRFLTCAELGLPDAIWAWMSFVDEDDIAALLRSHDPWALHDYRAIWDSTEGGATLDRLLELNLRTYLLDDLLPKADRMSMAHGLEVRSPLLDRDLLDLAFRLPPRTKVRGLSLKRVLKEAVRDLLPPEILARGKRGFSVPVDRWFREDLRPYVEAHLGARDARVRHHMSGGALDGLLTQHFSGARSRGGALWALLTLEVFLRREGW